MNDDSCFFLAERKNILAVIIHGSFLWELKKDSDIDVLVIVNGVVSTDITKRSVILIKQLIPEAATQKLSVKWRNYYDFDGARTLTLNEIAAISYGKVIYGKKINISINKQFIKDQTRLSALTRIAYDFAKSNKVNFDKMIRETSTVILSNCGIFLPSYPQRIKAATQIITETSFLDLSRKHKDFLLHYWQTNNNTEPTNNLGLSELAMEIFYKMSVFNDKHNRHNTDYFLQWTKSENTDGISGWAKFAAKFRPRDIDDLCFRNNLCV